MDTPIEIRTSLIRQERYIGENPLDLEWGEMLCLNIFPLERTPVFYCNYEGIVNRSINHSFLDKIKIAIVAHHYTRDQLVLIRKALPHTKIVLGPYHSVPFHRTLLLSNLESKFMSIRELLRDIKIDAILIVGLYGDAKCYEKTFDIPVFSCPAIPTKECISNYVSSHMQESQFLPAEMLSMKGRIFFCRKQQPVMFGTVDYEKLSTIAPVSLITEMFSHTPVISPDLYNQFSTDKVDITEWIPTSEHREHIRLCRANIHLEHTPVWGRVTLSAHVLGNPTISTDSLWSNILYPDLQVLSQYDLTNEIIRKIRLIDENKIELHQDAEKNLEEYLAPNARKRAESFITQLLG